MNRIDFELTRNSPAIQWIDEFEIILNCAELWSAFSYIYYVLNRKYMINENYK